MNHVWPHLVTLLGESLASLSPDYLLLFLTAESQFKKVIKSDLKNKWKTKHIMSKEHYQQITNIVMVIINIESYYQIINW